MPTEPTHSGELLRIGDQVIRFDRSCTEAQYKIIETSDAETCGCSHCRNFIAQRKTAYPSSFLDLLENLESILRRKARFMDVGPCLRANAFTVAGFSFAESLWRLENSVLNAMALRIGFWDQAKCLRLVGLSAANRLHLNFRLRFHGHLRMKTLTRMLEGLPCSKRPQ